MSYKVITNVAHINGQSGQYDSKVQDSNVKYGRNAISSHHHYLQSKDNDTLELKTPKTDQEINNMHKFLKQMQRNKLIPVDFKLKYLPESKVVASQLNKLALIGASFQDLGKKISVPLQEMNAKIQETFGKKVTAEAFDVNNDGQIDIAENATAILIKDMADQHSVDEVLQTGKLDLDANDIDGVYTNDGETLFWNFLKTDKVAQSKPLITQIYNAFGLDKAKELFAKNPNNLAE